jgi:hypothetical protein
MFHLALADRLLDRTNDILDRHVGIDAMLITFVIYFNGTGYVLQPSSRMHRALD